MFHDPNDDGLNESQPPESMPYYDDIDDEIPLEDLDPEVIQANLAILAEPDSEDFAEDMVP